MKDEIEIRKDAKPLIIFKEDGTIKFKNKEIQMAFEAGRDYERASNTPWMA